MKPDLRRIFLSMGIPFFLLFILYIIKWLESGMGWDFTHLGIYPRELYGFFGIFSYPLIHSGWEHLFANSFPLFFLTWCLYYFYRDTGSLILIFIWLIGGLLTYLIGKPGWHIGASGVIYGLAFFLFFSGIIRKIIPLLALSLLIVFLYGGLVWNMFPAFAAETTSWEGHLGGAIAGFVAAFLFRNRGPQSKDPFDNEETNDDNFGTDEYWNEESENAAGESTTCEEKSPEESTEKLEGEGKSDTVEGGFVETGEDTEIK